MLGTSPRRRGTAAAAARFGSPSFLSTDETWWSTVFSERNKRSASWAFVRPCANRASTSNSRAVCPAGLARVCCRGPRGIT